MSTSGIFDLFQEAMKLFPPSNLPDVNERILMKIRGGESFTIVVREGKYSLEEREPEAPESIVEVSGTFLCQAINGTLDTRTLWTAFAEPKDDSLVKKGNGASLLPLIQSMKKAYQSKSEIKNAIDSLAS
ncbi:MAG TPA: hypothetical protein VMX95_02270 [Thermodesulfobacteriota bacterium]|nr:hypothetical protein [Thermodesulfobacteriota bacterium]